MFELVFDLLMPILGYVRWKLGEDLDAHYGHAPVHCGVRSQVLAALISDIKL
jgi:hypothetical protein